MQWMVGVNHKILLEKLEFYEVVGKFKFKALIESYLTDIKE
jgi:hypothetical protein